MKKIISTGKSEHMPKSKVYSEGEALAKVLVDGGFAVYADAEKAEVEPAKEKVETPPITAKKKK